MPYQMSMGVSDREAKKKRRKENWKKFDPYGRRILWWEGKLAEFEQCYKSSLHFFHKYLFLLLSFPFTFFLTDDFALLLSLWHELCMTTFNDDSKGKSPFQPPVHLSITLQTLTSSSITLLFLSRSSKMATDIRSLAPGLDGHVVRLVIGRKGLRKTWSKFFLGPLTFHCRIS
jgi:hypothetical protein